MSLTLRIGNAHGFWGDRLQAAAEMLSAQPDLDYLTLDFLAEVSMSIMAAQQRRDPQLGYAGDFIPIVNSLVPYWQSGGRCRVVTNAGGLNPLGCAQACAETLQRAGCGDRLIAVVSGDNVMEQLRQDAISPSHAERTRNLDTGESIDGVLGHLMTANAYLGAAPIAAALAQNADLVITGRVADPSLTVGPCLHHFGWSPSDHDQIAGATIAGHLIECGTQVTGGIFTDWMSIPAVDRIGFPIVEIDQEGSCIVTKTAASGGSVTESTVKEQLLYELGDPDHYLSPDATVSFTSLRVREQSRGRVAVVGARGQAPPESYKVSATYDDGYRAAGQLTIFGSDAAAKSRRAADSVLRGLEELGFTFQNRLIEIIGDGAWNPSDPSLRALQAVGSDRLEVVLRIAVADRSRESVEAFTRAMMPLVTAGPPGTTGYAEGRPRIHPLVGYWPCLIGRDRVRWNVELLPAATAASRATSRALPARGAAIGNVKSPLPALPIPVARGTLEDVAYARSGDKGICANIGVIARQVDDFDQLRKELTPTHVADYLKVNVDNVTRYELPNLAALNFVIRGILDNPLRVDAQGKTLGQVLLQMPFPATPSSD